MDYVTVQIYEQEAAILEGLIKKFSRPNMVVFELGTYTGRSALVMLPHIQKNDGRLYCVDWFKGNPGVKVSSDVDLPPDHPARINITYREHNILDIFLKNLKESSYRDLVTILVGSTDSVASIVADETADFIFLDADHRYTAMRNDILNWYPKLKKGGLFCGHDFERRLDECNYDRVLEKCEEDNADNCHYGVIRAVCEFFPNVSKEGTIWYVEKTTDSPSVLDFVPDGAPKLSFMLSTSVMPAKSASQRRINTIHAPIYKRLIRRCLRSIYALAARKQSQ